MPHISGQGRSTLGKRKSLSLCSGDTKPCHIGMTLSAQARGMNANYELKANCWLKDEEGREIGFVLDHATLLTLHSELGRMIADLRIEK